MKLFSVFLIALLGWINPVFSQKMQILCEHWKTKQGTPVVFFQAMEVPMLDISIAFYAGSAYDGEKFGLSALTTEMLDQGNAKLSADQIAEQFAEVGSQFSTESSRDSIILNVRTLNTPEALHHTTHTLQQIISQPDFPEKAFDQKKNQQLLLIKQREESGDVMADQTFYQALYQDHPYAHSVDGLTSTVSRLELKDIKNFYQTFFSAKNAVIVIVGAIDKTTAIQLANQLTLNLPVGKKAPSLPEPKMLKEEINIEVPMHLTQTALRLGQIGINQQDQDYFPLLVGNYILGGGSLVSTLAIELREKRGLTYGVSSQFIPLRSQGPFIISLSTKNQQTRETEQLTRQFLNHFIEAGPSAAELNAAKQYLIGNFPLSIASNQNMARILLKIALFELPNDYLETYIKQIEAVTIEDIKQAFKKHIHPNKLVNVQVGKT